MALKQPRYRAGCSSDAVSGRSPVRARRGRGKVKRRDCYKAPQAAPSDVFVLDMDGTLVDSEPEVSGAGIRAAIKYWPDAFTGGEHAVVEQLLPSMRPLRPVMRDSHETMVMARLLNEGKKSAQLLNDWPAAFEQAIEKFEVQEDDLEQFFEDFRHQWMNTVPDDSPESYISANQPFPGVQHALRMCEFPYYIASSKREARVAKLATDVLKIQGFEEGSPRMVADLMPPSEKKTEALGMLMGRPLLQDKSVQLHFVDDRAETLLHMAQQPHLQRWNLYFADWGYSTEEHKSQVAETAPLIRTINLKQFEELLKWGMLSGVDDGCEPEEEEKRAAIAEANRRA